MVRSRAAGYASGMKEILRLTLHLYNDARTNTSSKTGCLSLMKTLGKRDFMDVRNGKVLEHGKCQVRSIPVRASH